MGEPDAANNPFTYPIWPVFAQTGPSELRKTTLLGSTLWQFNIAMENHHF